MEKPSSQTDVLIVGAGPTGLMLACGLAKRGVSFRIIDMKEGLSTLVKASELTPRSLEALEDFDLVEEALRLGVSVHSFKMYAQGKLVWQAQYGEIDSPYKFQVHLGQPYTEKLLHGYLKNQGGRVEWQTELAQFFDLGDQVEAILKSADGKEEKVRAKYLAGCDGASSTVRALLKLPYGGHTYQADNLIGNAILEWDRPPDEVYVFFTEEGEMTVSPLPDGYHQINGAFPLGPGQKPRKGQAGTLEELQAMFDRRSHIPGKIRSAERINYYWVHHRQVDKQKIGRVFLLGDAAHIISPNTGLGMNTGLQDAMNLAWKLAIVLGDAGREELLDSYQAERHGVLKALGQFSDLTEGMYLLQNPVSRALRDHVMTFLMGLEPFLKRQHRSLSQTDVNYRGSPIVAQDLGFPLHWPGSKHLTDHGSCPAAWFEFAEGPHAGDRAPDVRPIHSKNAGQERLYESLRHGKHSLLLFLGEENPEARTMENLQMIAEGAQELYGDWIEVFWILPGAATSVQAKKFGHLLKDPKSVAHQRYGAKGACLYLIRPDRFVGYRSLPPDWKKFKTYLKNNLFK